MVGADAVPKKLGEQLLNMNIELKVYTAISNQYGRVYGNSSTATIAIKDGIPSISYAGGHSGKVWLNDDNWWGDTYSITISSYN